MHDGTGAGWDTNSPLNTEPAPKGAQEMRDLRLGVQARVGKEHVTPAPGTAGGEHRQGSAKAFVLATFPTQRPDATTDLTSEDEGRALYKTDNGVLYLYYGGNWVIPLTGVSDGDITTAKLGNLSVTTAKLANDAVTSAKIAANAVDSSEIAAGAVTHSKIGAAAVQQDNLAAGTLAPEYYACYADEKADGTNGGTFTTGAWRTRDLTIERVDTNNIGTLAANVVTLGAGTYRVRGWATASGVGKHQVRLRKTSSGGATMAYGSSARSAANTSSLSLVETAFTIAGAETFTLEHSCETTVATTGFGAPGSFGGVEVYSVLEIYRRA